MDRYRLYLRIFGLVVAASVAGCSTNTNQQRLLADCYTVACIHEQAAAEIAAQRRDDLFWYPRRTARHQRAIDRQYRYPLTSWDNFTAWSKLGNTGPSPYEWCRAYADVRMKAYRQPYQ